MIRLADFQRDFAALRGSNLLDQLAQQPLPDAAAAGCCSDHDVFQFPCCVDSVGYEECKDSRTCGWDSLRLRSFVVFNDPSDALGFLVSSRNQGLILISRPVAGSRALALQIHHGWNISSSCRSDAHARIRSFQASRRRCGGCNSPPTARALRFGRTESCASQAGQRRQL